MRAAAAARRALLAWYDASRRDLPWRRTRDPYRIWLSETMLQQTRVETVVPYYERFLARFPDVGALAGADVGDVLGAWAGLGYYGRARNLHAAARAIVADHGGELPREVAELERLPGVGRYTAGAVASIAFGRPAPVVDGNVARVLARWLDLREDVASAAARERLWETARALAGGPRPGDLNQALMELGATLCTPRAPRCPACPLRRRCRARAAGDPEALPVKRRKAVPRRVAGVCALVVRGGRALAVRRAPGGLLGGLWELPGGEVAPRETQEAALARALRGGLGLEAGRTARLGRVDHLFSHRALALHVFRVDAPAGRLRLSGFEAHRWSAPAALARLPMSAVMRKALALAAP